MYLQFEGVRVVWTGSKISMNQSPSTEWSTVWNLIFLSILWLHTLSVADGGVGGANRLTTYNQTQTPGLQLPLEPEGLASLKDYLISFKLL